MRTSESAKQVSLRGVRVSFQSERGLEEWRTRRKTSVQSMAPRTRGRSMTSRVEDLARRVSAGAVRGTARSSHMPAGEYVR